MSPDGQWVAYAVRSTDARKDERTWHIWMTSWDGRHSTQVTQSPESEHSPGFSPDGRYLTFLSARAEKDGPDALWLLDRAGGDARQVTHFKGDVTDYAWSPDGRKLALALSYVGNPEIFVLDLGSRQETRLTNSLAIDTEPTWAPDGQSIYFTSDRSGRPQIYQVPAGGGAAERVTFQGQNNLKASVSYDGKQIAMVQGNGNVYRIAILDRSLGGQVRYVSPGPIDDAVSFAPNASMLLYAATEGSRGVLYSVSNDGMVRQRLALAAGNVQEPAWGPYRQR